MQSFKDFHKSTLLFETVYHDKFREVIQYLQQPPFNFELQRGAPKSIICMNNNRDMQCSIYVETSTLGVHIPLPHRMKPPDYYDAPVHVTRKIRDYITWNVPPAADYDSNDKLYARNLCDWYLSEPVISFNFKTERIDPNSGLQQEWMSAGYMGDLPPKAVKLYTKHLSRFAPLYELYNKVQAMTGNNIENAIELAKRYGATREDIDDMWTKLRRIKMDDVDTDDIMRNI